MKTLMSIGILMLLLASGFIFYSYDRSDGGVKILNYDDYKDINLDKRFEEVSKEVEDYGGAMIVSYDIETGEIISKRPAYEEREEGVFSVRTQEEADLVLGKVHNGVEVFIIEEDVSPSISIEAGSKI